jgi:hypothetical protein
MAAISYLNGKSAKSCAAEKSLRRRREQLAKRRRGCGGLADEVKGMRYAPSVAHNLLFKQFIADAE